jgi:hypothetical protein
MLSSGLCSAPRGLGSGKSYVQSSAIRSYNANADDHAAHPQALSHLFNTLSHQQSPFRKPNAPPPSPAPVFYRRDPDECGSLPLRRSSARSLQSLDRGAKQKINWANAYCPDKPNWAEIMKGVYPSLFFRLEIMDSTQRRRVVFDRSWPWQRATQRPLPAHPARASWQGSRKCRQIRNCIHMYTYLANVAESVKRLPAADGTLTQTSRITPVRWVAPPDTPYRPAVRVVTIRARIDELRRVCQALSRRRTGRTAAIPIRRSPLAIHVDRRCVSA